MSHTVLDILALFFGCALFMIILIVTLTYREIKIKKEAIKRDKGKDFVAMRLYGEHVKAERDRKLNSHNDLRHMPAFDSWKNHMKDSMSNTSNHDKPDRLLGVMQDFFAELQERDKTNDKTS